MIIFFYEEHEKHEADSNNADLALVEVVDNCVVERFFELSLGLGAMELKLATHVI